MSPHNNTSARPFVGVCGAQSTDDLLRLEEYASKYLLGTDRFLMAGIKNPSADIRAGYHSKLVRPFVHCDFSDTEPFEQVIERTLKLSGHYAQGLQLNMVPWMEVDYSSLWQKLKHRYPELLLMLQVPRDMMARYSPRQIADKLPGVTIDYIFFDPSQSRGVPYNPKHMRQYVTMARLANQSVAVAGGLGGSAMSTLFRPLEKQHPELSCDAFGCLVDSQTNRLSWPAVDSYLAAWRQIMTAVKAPEFTVTMYACDFKT